MPEVVDISVFWNMRHTLTHNALINLIVGNRGGGKSYGWKELAVNNFIKKKEQFGYIRRYRDDLKEPLEQFFKDIAQEFPDYECMVKGSKVYIRKKSANEEEERSWTEDDIAGYGFVLSTANNRKSISYPDITLLGFDEFLLEEGNQKYLPGEVDKLLNLYETIARPGSGHKRVTLWLLGNAISITNPYFLYWDLKMPKKQDKNGKWIWKHPTRPILVEDVRNEGFIDAKQNTEFGAVVKGTKYADYSIENKFLLDDDTFIERKSQNARHQFNFIYRDQKYGVWADYSEGKMWVSESIDPYGLTYSFTLKDHSPNTMLMKSRNKTYYLKHFIEGFKDGIVFFETMNIKNLCYEILKMTIN